MFSGEQLRMQLLRLFCTRFLFIYDFLWFHTMSKIIAIKLSEFIKIVFKGKGFICNLPKSCENVTFVLKIFFPKSKTFL